MIRKVLINYFWLIRLFYGKLAMPVILSQLFGEESHANPDLSSGQVWRFFTPSRTKKNSALFH
jgi:hypothetical protein